MLRNLIPNLYGIYIANATQSLNIGAFVTGVKSSHDSYWKYAFADIVREFRINIKLADKLDPLILKISVVALSIGEQNWAPKYPN